MLPPRFWRLAFDLTFYIIIAVILLNGVIVGIISTTFGELKDAAQRNKQELSSSCFVCGCPHEDFDGEGGFAVHVRKRHNLWKYVNLVLHLQVRRPSPAVCLHACCLASRGWPLSVPVLA